jgi:type I restriction enzyme, S subunit
VSYPAYPEYKNIDWKEIGVIPAGWETRRLKFAVTCNDDVLPDSTAPDFEMQYVDISSVDLINGITSFEDFSFDDAPSRARRISKDGDTIISTVRTYLKSIATVSKPPINMVVSTGFAVVRPHAFMHSGFLGYVLQSSVFIDAIVANSSGVSYPAINPSVLVCLPFCYPKNIAEQQKIALFLDHKTAQIDALIAKKKELIGKLQEQRLAVITQAVTKGLNPAAAIRDSGVTWLGDVPAHWEVKSIKRLTPVARGASPRPIDDPKYFDDEGEYAWVRIADVTSNDYYLKHTTQRLSELGQSMSVTIEPGHLFLSIAGSVGKPMIAAIKACIHDGFVYFPQLEMNPEFLFFIFDSGQPYLGLGKLGTQLNLNTDTVGSIKIGVPPNHEQMAIVSYIKTEGMKIQKLVTSVQLKVKQNQLVI